MRSLFFVALALLGLACQAAPPERLQKVGRVERSYVDHQRLNWTGDGPRPMRSVIWFPTDDVAQEEPWLIGNRFFPFFKAGWAVSDATLSDRIEHFQVNETVNFRIHHTMCNTSLNWAISMQ